MYLTVKQQLKHLSKDEYEILRDLTHIAKNLTNEALYNVRQYFFNEGKYLNYIENYKLLKDSCNYKILNSNMSQQILREVDGQFKSFFALLKKAQKGEYDFKDIHIPHYLPKDGYTTLSIQFVRLKDDKIVLPYSISYKKEHELIEIKLPPILKDKKIKEITIKPKAKARFFEIQYSYEADTIQRNLNQNKALALDPGINNFVTAVTSDGKSFIIDGKKLKSINQRFNKFNSKLQSIKDKQNIKRTTKLQSRLTIKRANQIRDYVGKTGKYIIEYCIKNDIGTLVFGFNKDFQQDSSLGTKNNQNFVNIPFGQLKDKLKYLCELNDIIFIEQEESYTSKASFLDRDEIPVYDENDPQEYTFSGKRIKRGLYKSKDGSLINADVNGALNILRKSNVVSEDILYSRGGVTTPIRIRIA